MAKGENFPGTDFPERFPNLKQSTFLHAWERPSVLSLQKKNSFSFSGRRPIGHQFRAKWRGLQGEKLHQGFFSSNIPSKEDIDFIQIPKIIYVKKIFVRKTKKKGKINMHVTWLREKLMPIGVDDDKIGDPNGQMLANNFELFDEDGDHATAKNSPSFGVGGVSDSKDQKVSGDGILYDQSAGACIEAKTAKGSDIGNQDGSNVQIRKDFGLSSAKGHRKEDVPKKLGF
jgi:hypothetical protein